MNPILYVGVCRHWIGIVTSGLYSLASFQLATARYVIF